MARKRIPLHTKILLGLLFGLLFGLLCIFTGIPNTFVIYYIKPFGTIFVNALKMVAMPLILASLIVGVANLGDISKLSRMGGRTIGVYMITTVIATTIGLLIVNIIKPGKIITPETRTELMGMFEKDVFQKTGEAQKLREEGPLQPLVNIIPENLFESAAENANMLQIVFFAIIFGVALLQIKSDKKHIVIGFFDGLNDVIIRIIHYIMMLAPYGVFALIATLIVEIAGNNASKALEILSALLLYSATVLIGLLIMILVVYPTIFKIFTKVKYRTFFKGIREAQLLAFSTSSSSATLPVTMESVENNLNVSEEVSSFVLPLGATINMDGTSLYQSVAAVFIAHAMGLELSLTSQLAIIITAVLASIGSAGVPGAGMVMLVIVLEAAGIPAAGLALIIAPDRPLDMCRTVVNVTGDATVAMVVASAEGEQVGGKRVITEN
ncbi:MAG: dicarboxylate/amino acid:cation symporter [Cyclobacteriaceae bacterium]|nr:dicarboxylate/amino acid:cation symporter [Cyclobacteriaceae bacterium]